MQIEQVLPGANEVGIASEKHACILDIERFKSTKGSTAGFV